MLTTTAAASLESPLINQTTSGYTLTTSGDSHHHHHHVVGDNGSNYTNGTSGNSSGFPADDTSGDLCRDTFYEYVDYTQIAAVWWLFVALYTAVIVLSLVGNLMVIWTILRFKYMRTVTNYYILNLAVCDFLVSLLVMPLKLLEYAGGGGACGGAWAAVSVDAVCSVLCYILPVFVFESVFTLVAISTERYHAIVHPFESRKIHSMARTVRIVVLTWIAAIVLPAPLLYCKSYPFSIKSDFGIVSRQICNDRFDEIDIWMYGPDSALQGSFRRGFCLFLFLALYLIPSVIIVATCARISLALFKPWSADSAAAAAVDGGGCGALDSRVTRRQEENKRKVARMIIIVAVTFVCSWTPFYLVNLISQVQEDSFLRRSNFLFTMLSTYLCGFVNSSINPIVYHAMSDRFRRSFHDIWFRLLSLLCCGTRQFRGLNRHSVRGSSSFSSAGGSVRNHLHHNGPGSGGSQSRTGSTSVMTTYTTNIAMTDSNASGDGSPKGVYLPMTAKNGHAHHKSACLSRL